MQEAAADGTGRIRHKSGGQNARLVVQIPPLQRRGPLRLGPGRFPGPEIGLLGPRQTPGRLLGLGLHLRQGQQILPPGLQGALPGLQGLQAPGRLGQPGTPGSGRLQLLGHGLGAGRRLVPAPQGLTLLQPQLLQGPAAGLQPVILGQQLPEGLGLGTQPLGLGLLGRRLGQRLGRLVQGGRQPPDLLLQPKQVGPGLFHGSGLAQLPIQDCQHLLDLVALGGQAGRLGLGLLGQRPGQLQALLGHRLGLQRGQRLAVGRIRPRLQPRQLPEPLALPVADLVAQGLGLLLDPVLKLAVAAGLEDLPENLDPVLGFGLEQPQKVPLGDHGDLRKLVPVQAQQRRHGGGDLPPFGHRLAAVGIVELRLGPLGGEARAPLLGPEILRRPPDAVDLAPALEGQLHKGGPGRRGIVAPQHVRLAAAAAGLAVEGEADGVKNRGLPCPGVAGNQVQAPVPQLGKIQPDLAAVGAEGAYHQHQRSHSPSSQISSISRRARARWSSDRGSSQRLS